jgi:hypothetical protein|tara:strand:+ start:299 stop:490 length:192 start_codon:yes stop_codon:yes gene_type:complete
MSGEIGERIFPMVVYNSDAKLIMFYVGSEGGSYLIQQTPISRGCLREFVRRGREILDRTENFA